MQSHAKPFICNNWKKSDNSTLCYLFKETLTQQVPSLIPHHSWGKCQHIKAFSPCSGKQKILNICYVSKQISQTSHHFLGEDTQELHSLSCTFLDESTKETQFCHQDQRKASRTVSPHPSHCRVFPQPSPHRQEWWHKLTTPSWKSF